MQNRWKERQRRGARGRSRRLGARKKVQASIRPKAKECLRANSESFYLKIDMLTNLMNRRYCMSYLPEMQIFFSTSAGELSHRCNIKPYRLFIIVVILYCASLA